MKTDRSVLVLVNPRSGLPTSFSVVRRALDRHWDVAGCDLAYQFSQSKEDGAAKARRAVARGVDTILVAGGDGTLSSIGRVLLGTGVALGSIPLGSGNGFARHFGIPLASERAVAALAGAEVRAIDVGVVDDRPFLVTCSMAWDAAIARSFAKTPIRGVVPYLFAGVHEFLLFEAQEMVVEIDGGEQITFPDPLVFTVANLSQYGGGAKIAPEARPDDGFLELVVALRQDVPKLIANVGRLFNGSVSRIPEVVTHRFRSLAVRRGKATPIQVDGELVPAGETVTVGVKPRALKVLAP